MDAPMMKVGEAAEFVGVSVATFLRRVADGSMPTPVKIGRLSRWPRAEVIASIEEAKTRRSAARKVEASPDPTGRLTLADDQLRRHLAALRTIADAALAAARRRFEPDHLNVSWAAAIDPMVRYYVADDGREGFEILVMLPSNYHDVLSAIESDLEAAGWTRGTVAIRGIGRKKS